MNIQRPDSEPQIGDIRCGVCESDNRRYIYMEKFDAHTDVNLNDLSGPATGVSKCWQRVISINIPEGTDADLIAKLELKIPEAYEYALSKFLDVDTPESLIEHALMQILLGSVFSVSLLYAQEVIDTINKVADFLQQHS